MYGTKFVVQTDHHSLQWFMKATTHAHLVSWGLRLSEFDFVIRYKRVENKYHNACSKTGKLKDFQLKLHIDETVQTVKAKKRNHSLHLHQQQIKEEVKRCQSFLCIQI